MASARRLLILGLGNVLLADDGLGVAGAALFARRYELPEEVSVLDGGTLGLALLPRLEAADDAILVDAVRADGPPGSLVRLAGEDVPPAVHERLSPHQVGVADLLDGMRLRGRLPRRIVLLGLVPASLELAVGRSPAVAAALPALVESIAAEARRMGYPIAARTDDADDVDHEAARAPFDDRLARLFGL